jgi:hypothetical protein
MEGDPTNLESVVRSSRPAYLVVLTALMSLSALGSANLAQVDLFSGVRYDAGRDELAITMAYRGTNPDHTFSLKSGTCQTRPVAPNRNSPPKYSTVNRKTPPANHSK